MTLTLIGNDTILETRSHLRHVVERALGVVIYHGPIVIYPDARDWSGHGIRDDQVELIPREMIAETYEVTCRKSGKLPELHRVFVLRCGVDVKSDYIQWPKDG